MPEYRSFGLSDPGQVRSNNEDLIHFDDQRGIYFVIDGMGGHAAGEQAAAIAGEHLKARLERQTGAPDQRIREGIALANNAIHDAAAAHPEWEGMACVLTVALLVNGHATIGHVGDTRLYKIRDGALEKLTHDHSPVGEREDNGELTEQEAMKHPRRNEVFRDVGSQPHDPDDAGFIELLQIAMEPDAALLLCSDGLSDVLPAAELLGAIERADRDPERSVESLVRKAAGTGKDNVSAVLVAGPSFTKRPITEAPAKHRGLSPLLYLLAGLLLGAFSVIALTRFLAPAATHVPQRLVVANAGAPYRTIPEAMAIAEPGDTIEVAPGEYVEPIQLKAGVRLLSQKPHQAVIRVPGTALSAEGLASATVEGMSLAGADTGIAVHNSFVDLLRVHVTGARRAGIVWNGNSGGVLSESSIFDNPGAGIQVLDAAAPLIRNNRVFHNGRAAAHLQPGLEILSLTSPRLEANGIYDNGAEPLWTAVPPTPALLQDNYFSVGGAPAPRRIVRLFAKGEKIP